MGGYGLRMTADAAETCLAVSGSTLTMASVMMLAGFFYRWRGRWWLQNLWTLVCLVVSFLLIATVVIDFGMRWEHPGPVCAKVVRL